MSRWEKTGERDLSFSTWHRDLGGGCDMMDIDALQFCHKCKEPLAIFELYLDGQEWKPASVLKNLGRRLNVPAYCVGYHKNADGEFCGPLRIERLHPCYNPPRQCDVGELESLIRRIHRRCRWCNYENPASLSHE